MQKWNIQRRSRQLTTVCTAIVHYYCFGDIQKGKEKHLKKLKFGGASLGNNETKKKRKLKTRSISINLRTKHWKIGFLQFICFNECQNSFPREFGSGKYSCYATLMISYPRSIGKENARFVFQCIVTS